MKANTGNIMDRQTMVGVLIPSGWDDDFKVSRVSLACDGEREVAIGNLKDRPDLLALLRRRVRIAGTVTETAHGESVMVESCRLE